MATTERRLQEINELEELWDRSPDADRPAPPKRAARDLQPVLLGGWIVVLATIFMFEPAADPNAVVPAWGQLLLSAFMAGFFATTYGLAGKRRWGAGASAATAGLGIAIGVACAATDHHAGGWAAYEVASFSALGALSLAAFRTRG